MSDEKRVQKRRKRYKRFLYANYKTEDVHPRTEKRWRREADNLKIFGAESTPSFFTEEHLTSDIEYMSDSDLGPFLESSGEKLSDENPRVNFENVPNQQTSEIIDKAQQNVKENFKERELDTNEVRKKDSSPSKEKCLREVFNEMSSVLMFSDAKLTIREVSLMTIGLCIRFNLTYVIRQALFNLVKCLAGPKFEEWNTTKFNISRMYDPPNESINICFFCNQYYCPLLRPISKAKFENCNATCKYGETCVLTTQKHNYIVNIDLQYQIKMLLENKEVETALLENMNLIKNRLNENSTNIADGYDSFLYKELMQKYSSECHVLTYIFNTDGAPIFHSSKQSLWPIQIIIDELPPNLRFKYPLLAGIYILKKEPSPNVMNMYMEQFLEQTKSLREEGFQISNESGEPLALKLLPLCSSVDSVARPIIQNRLQYNGHYGCSWCYDFEKYEQTMRYPVVEKNADLRTNVSHREDVVSVVKNGKTINGVKGASILMTILCLNMIWRFPIDYMHGVLLGVTKQLSEFWVNLKIIKAKDIRRIDELLANITPPREIHRQPRPFSDRAHWKATEWKSWILFYVLPCVQDILPIEHFEHLSLFVQSLFTLLKGSISEIELQKCEEDSITFVVRIANNYTE